MTTWTLQDFTPEEEEAWAMMEKEQQYEQERKQRMTWNNRIVKITTEYGDGETETVYEICEVYYNGKNETVAYCDARLIGDTFDELREVYSRMTEAFKYPTLDSQTDFNHKFDDGENDGKEIA
jgi:hypothetical protein